MSLQPPLTSQNGEDFLILSAFESRTRGFFVDIGAFDGVHLSNTWALERLGWSGICLEPLPQLFPLLTKNRPGSRCIEAAAGPDSGISALFTDPTLMFSSQQSEDRVRTAFQAVPEFRGLDTHSIEKLEVEVVTLDDVLRRAQWRGGVDLVNIDVAGSEKAVLAGFDVKTHAPRVIVVAASDETSQHDVTRHLESAGYELCRTVGPTLFFAMEETLTRRLSKTDVSCFLPRNLHPFGIAHTRLDQRNDRVLLHGRGLTLHELAALERTLAGAPSHNGKTTS